MPRSKKPPRKGGAEPMGMPSMGMFGMYGGDDDDDDGRDQDLEAELNQLLGASKPKARAPAKPKGKQLMDWSELDAQISASMRDSEDDEDLGDEDEGEFMAELEGLVEPDELEAPTPNKRRSPSPQPQATGGDQLSILIDRKKNYESAIQNSSGAKLRRLQRGSKTLDGLIKQAKAGKPVSEDDIPPQVAVGNPAAAAAQSQASAPSVTVSPPPMKPASPEKAPPTPTRPAPPPRPVPRTPQTESSTSAQASQVDHSVVKMLAERQQEFKKAALASKNAGNKAEALKYLKIIKQFDSVITAAKEGKPVDLSQMPTLPGETPAPKPVAAPKPAAVSQPVASQSAAPPAAQAAGAKAPSPQPAAQQGIPVPKTLLEGLQQRQQKYQSSADQAKAEGNGGKSRRMLRIVKQYDDAIRAHRAGKNINVVDLPVPIGFPPLPGVNEKQVDPADMLEQAGNLLKTDDDEERPQPPIAQAALAASAARPAARTAPQSHLQPNAKPQARAPSPKLVQTSNEPRTAYQNQVEFLINRQNAFKQAALEAKKAGDKETAMDMLKKMKGFQPMIEQAKNGLKVDITKAPQPPVIHVSQPPRDDKNFEIINPAKSHEGDDEVFKKLQDTLKEQVKKARGYSEQFTHSGDVNGANMFDRLATDSQRDLDFVKNLQRHSDAPPRYYFEEKTFESVHIIPELQSGEMELIIVQLLDLDGNAKDVRPFVEWEMPFPHDNPIKGRTEEHKLSTSPKYDAHFRVPITRKNKAFQRAIKNKAIKFQVMQKGGFLRSDKSFGSASIKLAPLETSCEIRAVEPLREGRAATGKIEAKIRMRTPLIGSESRTMTERWLVVSHDYVRKTAPRPSQGHSASSGAHQKQPQKSKDSKIGSLEVLALEKKMVDAKIQSIQAKGQRPPTSVLQNLQSIQGKIAATKKFLNEGGVNAKRTYVQYLKSELTNLKQEAQANVKQGRHDQAKFVLTKRKMVENELAKIAPANTYL